VTCTAALGHGTAHRLPVSSFALNFDQKLEYNYILRPIEDDRTDVVSLRSAWVEWSLLSFFSSASESSDFVPLYKFILLTYFLLTKQRLTCIRPVDSLNARYKLAGQSIRVVFKYSSTQS
jgi:hypothetical protein